jgi:hypothetical protein
MELFQLPPDFDTGQHTIVRVTASEVRKKLAQHYLAENGSYHAVRIDLPPGSYSTEFKWAAPSGETTVHGATPPNRNEHEKPAESDWRAVPVAHASRQAGVPGRLSWLMRTVIACLAAVFVSSAVFFVWRGFPAKPDSVSAKSTSVPGAFVPGALPNPSLGSANLRMIMGATTSYVDFLAQEPALIYGGKVWRKWDKTKAVGAGLESFVGQAVNSPPKIQPSTYTGRKTDGTSANGALMREEIGGPKSETDR